MGKGNSEKRMERKKERNEAECLSETATKPAEAVGNVRSNIYNIERASDVKADREKRWGLASRTLVR